MSATTARPAAGPRTGLTDLSSCCRPAESSVADEAALALATVFKALADPARVKIMSMLLNADEVCACDISTGIGKSAATASHHLRILKDSGLAVSEKRGTWAWFRLVPGRLDDVAAIFR